jgi:hypothetical protein
MTQTFYGNRRIVDGASIVTQLSRQGLIIAQRAIDALSKWIITARG